MSRLDSDRDTDVVQTEVSSVREPFGAAQVISLAIGIAFVVIGAVGLARTGLDDLSDRTQVGGMEMTAALSLIHLALGLIASIGGAGRSAARGILMFQGPTFIALGVIALIQEVRAMGWNETSGVVYLITGLIAMVGAIMTPNMTVSRRTSDVRASTHTDADVDRRLIL